MKHYGDVERVVEVRRECTRMTCDLCGELADNPHDEEWDWGGAGRAGGGVATVLRH